MRLLHSLIIAALVAGTAAEAADAADAAVTVKLIAFNVFHGAISPPVARTPVYDPQHPGSKNVVPAIAALVGDIGRHVKEYGSLVRVSAAAVKNVRNDMYLTSESLRPLDKSTWTLYAVYLSRRYVQMSMTTPAFLAPRAASASRAQMEKKSFCDMDAASEHIEYRQKSQLGPMMDYTDSRRSS